MKGPISQEGLPYKSGILNKENLLKEELFNQCTILMIS